jgi:pyruvyltransferase
MLLNNLNFLVLEMLFMRFLFFIFYINIILGFDSSKLLEKNLSEKKINKFNHFKKRKEKTTKNIQLYWWRPFINGNYGDNFGDAISKDIVEKISKRKVLRCLEKKKKLIAVGSIIQFAREGDIVWGSGINGKHPNRSDYKFKDLDVRAVRGPLTRKFLINMGIKCPEIYGDPALLLPILFPEFKKNPKVNYIVIPHISEEYLFLQNNHVVFPTENWRIVAKKVCESKFVIASSLHGIIVAEAFGVPARLLRITENEPLFKYEDYYLGTGRKTFKYARSVSEALEMGGEVLPKIDLNKLMKAFPYDFHK